MIITEKKSPEEILENLGAARSVYLFGCNSCAEQCQTGGERELKEMSRFLEEKGFEVKGYSIVDETCYSQLILREYRRKPEIKEADTVLVLACGAGVKTVADAAPESQPVVPALDSMFLASVERYGRFFEGCSLCGNCVLAVTGAICPHTDCAKGLLNGPCGGVVDGKCEVDVSNDCAWVKIYNRLKAQNRLDVMRKVSAPKDHSVGVKPRKVLLRESPEERKKKKG